MPVPGITNQRIRLALLAVALSTSLALPLVGQASSVPTSPALATPQAAETAGVRRQISKLEILQAIRAGMKEQGYGDPTDLELEDLHVQTSVWVTRHEAGLLLKRTEFDRVRQRTIFRVWTSKEPRLPPFEVTTNWVPFVEVAIAGHDLARGHVLTMGDVHVARRRVAARLREAIKRPEDVVGQRLCRPLSTGQVVTRNVLRTPVLVAPGKPATLVAVNPHVRISTPVIPLQPGSKGQLIRVRNRANQRIMKAEVVAAGLLQTTF
jgi:flagella basal body P-ring formation protein FlgA